MAAFCRPVGATWRDLGAILGASWGHLGASWGSWEGFRGCLRSVLGDLLGMLEGFVHDALFFECFLICYCIFSCLFDMADPWKTIKNHCFPLIFWIYLGVGDVARILKQHSIRVKTNKPKTLGKSMDLACFCGVWKSLEAGLKRFLATWASKTHQEAILSGLRGCGAGKQKPKGTPKGGWHIQAGQQLLGPRPRGWVGKG